MPTHIESRLSANEVSGRDLLGLLAASALVTYDGTATTTSLAAIGRSLQLRFTDVQWVGNASLLTMAALLVPAGVIADRIGRDRAVRLGLLVFAAASMACALAPAASMLIAGRLAQGAGAALILPGVLATLRTTLADETARVKVLGRLAATTALASAAGPLVAGALVDLASWRVVFVTSALIAAGAWWFVVKLQLPRGDRSSEPVPAVASLALVAVFGALSYVMIEAPRDASPAVFAVGLVTVPGAAILLNSCRRGQLFPRDLFQSRNCAAGNAGTFALYFAIFGLPFLLALYVQQVLGYSGSWAAAAILPLSLTMLFAEFGGTVTTRVGMRLAVIVGSWVSAAALLWLAWAPHPLPFWPHIIVAGAGLGVGASLMISPLTHATISYVPDTKAGVASALNHATARASGMAAIAALGSIAASHPAGELTPEGLARALIICAAVVAAGGTVSALFLDDTPANQSAQGTSNATEAA